VSKNLEKAINWDEIQSLHIYTPIQSLTEIDITPFVNWCQNHYPEIHIIKQTMSSDMPDVLADVVVLPCLSVDRTGNRVGYGGGFYDRLLSAWPNAKRIVVAYDKTVLQKIESEKHDRPGHVIVTEKDAVVI
jgi:hypothetical protein